MDQMIQQTNCSPNRNLMAVQMLRTLGYEQVHINKALPKLTGLSHPELSKRLGVSRQAVTHTMNCERTNIKLQSMIADAYGIPVDELFPKRG